MDTTLFDVAFPKNATTADGATTFTVDVSAWTEEKVAAVFAFALKEYANNRAGGSSKTSDDIVELLTQKTFDDWSPATGGGGRTPNAEVAFVAEMRIRLRTHLGMKLADVLEWTKGMDQIQIVDFARGKIARRMGAAGTPETIERVLNGHLRQIQIVLDARADDAGEPVTE